MLVCVIGSLVLVIVFVHDIIIIRWFPILFVSLLVVYQSERRHDDKR